MAKPLLQIHLLDSSTWYGNKNCSCPHLSSACVYSTLLLAAFASCQSSTPEISEDQSCISLQSWFKNPLEKNIQWYACDNRICFFSINILYIFIYLHSSAAPGSCLVARHCHICRTLSSWSPTLEIWAPWNWKPRVATDSVWLSERVEVF